jgi:hypothetical protein
MKSLDPTKLAPPGAGLPFPESAIATLRLRIRCLTGNRESFNERFKAERAEIAKLIAPLSPENLAQRLLIERPRGLEDSSRDWSVLMTLDHLRITNDAFGGFIRSLADGVEPERQVSTAAVKPNPGVGMEVIAQYEASCDDLLETLAAIPDTKTSARHRHPWFWKMNAHEWHALSGGHMGIHRAQIRRIIVGLGGSMWSGLGRK